MIGSRQVLGHTTSSSSRSLRPKIMASASSGSQPNDSRGSADKRRPGRGGKARTPGVFEVQIATPPPRSLGIYALPPLTHNGEEIEVDGSGYVVTSVVVQFKLRSGKYVRDHNRLEVQPTGRWILNQALEGLYKATYLGPTGPQD